MKLLRLGIEGFGTLRGEHRFDPERMTLVVDDNERGKSTLLAAITAALYGLSDDHRTHRPMTPLERWRPWDGGAFGVELEFECGGERYVVRRDFRQGQVSVWTHRGQEVTASFLEGKDEYPVGKVLLGLDADEFEKCAFVRQEELEQVVPVDEKDRRVNSLQARLERAADTRAGNSSAAEALRVLDEAAGRYTEPLLGSTVKVETAIQRLATGVAALDADLHALEHDYASIREPLERLAQIEQGERDAQERERRLNAERRAALAADARQKLERQRGLRAEYQRVADEIRGLQPYAGTPQDADARYQQAVARLEEHARQRAELEANERLLAGGLARLDGEIQALSAFASLDESHARHFISCAAEMRRLDTERERVVTLLGGARTELGRAGFDEAKITLLEGRFGTSTPARRELLEGQPRLSAELSAAGAEAESAAGIAGETLRAVSKTARGRSIPGWIAIGLALGLGLTAGLEVYRSVLSVPWQWLAIGAGGLGLLGLGAVLLVARLAGAAGREARIAAVDARERLEAISRRRRANDDALMALARETGAVDANDLLRSWSEFTEFETVRGTYERLGGELRALDELRLGLAHEAGDPPDAKWLDHAAEGIHTRIQKSQLRANLSGQLEGLRAQLAEIDARYADAGTTAVAVLHSAGLAPPVAGGSWAALADEVMRRTQAARRHALLTDELLPRAQKGMFDEDTVRQLQQVLAMLETEAEAAPIELEPGPAPRGLADIERESEAVHHELDALRGERNEHWLRVSRVSRDYHATHPEKLSEREAWEKALENARRFKDAVDLARETIRKVAEETHRRWAEFLNERVAEILGTVGTRIDQLRFGEDLDFAVKPRHGQQISRGKALRQLSSGARDQLHLGVRLAISEYLSRDESLPLLIDDCFATSDDLRARAGMKYLIGHLAGRHQIVLVTCHRSRFEAFAAQDPDLYRDRVHWIDTLSMRAAADQT